MSGLKGDPIPIESLTPISKDDPRASVTFDGQTMPKTPGMRRVKPAPFQRPSINISRHGRAWQMVRADEVEVGEMVVGVGRVVSTRTRISYVPRSELIPESLRTQGTPFDDKPVAVGVTIRLTGMGGTVADYDASEQVRTFAKRE